MYWGALIKWDVWWTVSVTGKITFVGSGLLRQKKKGNTTVKSWCKATRAGIAFFAIKIVSTNVLFTDSLAKNRQVATRHFLSGRCWHPVLTLGVNTYPNDICFGRCQHPVSTLVVDTYQKRYCFGRCQHLPKQYQRRYRFVRCQHHVILRCWHSVSTPT